MKAFFYKTLTTVIDDFGSMIIPMPWREYNRPTMTTFSVLTGSALQRMSFSPSVGMLP
jgi:hypothetical protein